jgi:hypothetical protein
VAIVETNGVAEHRQFPVEALELGRALRKRIEEFNKKCTTRDLELAFPSFLSRYGIDIKNSELAELVAACMNDEETTEGKLLKSLNGDAHPLLAAVEGKKLFARSKDPVDVAAGDIAGRLWEVLGESKGMMPSWPPMPPEPLPLATQFSSEKEKAKAQDAYDEREKERAAFGHQLAVAAVRGLRMGMQYVPEKQWLEADKRLLLVGSAVHGAMVHLCHLYSERVSGDALDRVVTQRDAVDPVKTAEMDIKNNALTKEQVRAMRLEKMAEGRGARVEERIKQTSSLHEHKSVADMEPEQLGEVLQSIRHAMMQSATDIVRLGSNKSVAEELIEGESARFMRGLQNADANEKAAKLNGKAQRKKHVTPGSKKLAKNKGKQ